MKRRAVVRKTDNDKALVFFSGIEECETCASKHVCMGIFPTRKGNNEAWLINTAKAKPGDLVEIEFRPSAAIATILTTFLVPVAGLLLGYSVGAPTGFESAAIGAGAGLIAGIILSIIINRSFSRNSAFQLEISGILKKQHCIIEK